MIDKAVIEKLVTEVIAPKPELFIGDILVKNGNIVFVFLDGDQGVLIEDCALVSRFIESQLDREREDYELTVSSFGADRPLKHLRQFKNNIGKEFQVKTTENLLFKGILKEIQGQELTFEIPPVKKKELSKIEVLNLENIVEAKRIISFKQK